MGRYDADYGTLLINKGNGKFTTEVLNGIAIKGQIRQIVHIKIGEKQAFILGRNNESARIIIFNALQN